MGLWRAPRRVSKQHIRPEHDASFFLALAFDRSTVSIQATATIAEDLAIRTHGALRGVPRWSYLRSESLHAGPAADVARALDESKRGPAS